jgi:hypothetical protein
MSGLIFPGAIFPIKFFRNAANNEVTKKVASATKKAVGEAAVATSTKAAEILEDVKQKGVYRATKNQTDKISKVFGDIIGTIQNGYNSFMDLTVRRELNELGKDIDRDVEAHGEKITRVLDQKIDILTNKIFSLLVDHTAGLSYEFLLPLSTQFELEILEIFRLNFMHYQRISDIAAFNADMQYPNNRKLTTVNFLLDLLCPVKEVGAGFASHDIPPSFTYYSSFKLNFSAEELLNASHGSPAGKLKREIDIIKKRISKCTPIAAPSDLLERGHRSPKAKAPGLQYNTSIRPAVQPNAALVLKKRAANHARALEEVRRAITLKRPRSESRSPSVEPPKKTTKKRTATAKKKPTTAAKSKASARTQPLNSLMEQYRNANRGEPAAGDSHSRTGSQESGEVRSDDQYRLPSRSPTSSERRYYDNMNNY